MIMYLNIYTAFIRILNQMTFSEISNACALHDLVPFELKKREKYPWKSVTFSTKNKTPPWVFFTFLK